MKGNEMDTTFAFERDLRGWLGAADPGGAPVSMRLRIAAELREEAAAATSPLAGLRTFGRRFAPLANVAGLAFSVALLGVVAAIAAHVGGSGPGAPTPIGTDVPAPGQIDGYGHEGMPVPIAALLCLVAGALAWAAVGTARFRAATGRLLSFGWPDRDAGGVVIPRLRTVPLRVWAIALALIACQIFLLASSNIGEIGLPGEWVAQELISLAADAVQTLVLVALLVRYRRLWRTDPLLLGGFFVYVSSSLVASLAWQAAVRLLGGPFPFEGIELLSVGADLAFVVFVVGVARRAGLRTPPSRGLAATGIGLSLAIAIAPFTRYVLVALAESLSIVATFVYVVGWLLLVWAGVKAWRSNRLGGRMAIALMTAAGVLEIAALVGQRLRAFYPADWFTQSLSGFAESATFGAGTNWYYDVTLALTIAASAGWVLLFLAAVIGLPRSYGVASSADRALDEA